MPSLTMNSKIDDLLVLTGNDILALFDADKEKILAAIKKSYLTYAPETSDVPHSSFLRFPDHKKNRIIALPAYIGESFNAAGIKWISSFPDNISHGIERASAVLILNSTQTGRPIAVMESSIISAWRTAASAALAVQCLQNFNPFEKVGFIGAGLINFTTLRFLLTLYPGIKKVVIYDISLQRAEQFQRKVIESAGSLQCQIEDNPEEIMKNSQVISIATNAVLPHMNDISLCQKGSIILHISLRDLSPEIILASDNIVDDRDHICRAQTSLHLAEQKVAHRNFIRATIGELLKGPAFSRPEGKISIFSPFGLGILDIALAKIIYEKACDQNIGHRIPNFFPKPWFERLPMYE